jgi:hypothetical protein
VFWACGLLKIKILSVHEKESTPNTRWDAFYDDDGKALRSTGAVQDITERKEAEARSATCLDAVGNLTLVSMPTALHK